MKCAFCEDFIINKEPVFKNDLALCYYDEFPVSKGHMLFITKRHVSTFFETTDKEKKAIFDLLEKAKKEIDTKYSPDGYNIGANCGEAAGQSVMHIHIHLIPRYTGDVSNPRGGVRGVIPNKKNY